jgi:RND superfamily putative drug exporter
MNRSARDGGWLSRSYAWSVVALRPLVVLAWIAAAVAALVLLPALGGSSSAPLSDIVPADAPALAAQQQAYDRFGSTLGADTVIVQRNPRGLSTAEVQANASAVLAAATHRLPPELAGVRAAVPLVNVPIPGLRWGESGTTVLTYLFLAQDLNLLERERTARLYAQRMLRPQPTTRTSVTGAGPARLQQFREIESVLPLVEIATVAVILVIVAVYFRSIGAPLVTLLTAAVAYVLAIRALAWTGERAGVTVPSEIEPVLVVLLLGLVTDYTIFFMSEARRRLLRGETPLESARRTTARIGPLVFTAGVLVAGGAVSLVAGRLEFFRVFGPGMAVAALVVTVVCLTFVPAVLALAGPRLFGRRAREAGPAPEAEPDRVATAPPRRLREGRRERWRLRTSGLLGALRASRTQAQSGEGGVAALFGARLLSTRTAAIPLAALTIVVLLVAAAGARSVDLAVLHIPSLPKDTEVRRGADDAARGLAPGVLAPTEVVLEQPGITQRRDALVRLQRDIARAPGVAAVLGPAQAVVSELEPAVLAKDGAAARLALFLDSEPTGANAIDALGKLRETMGNRLARAGLPADVEVSYAGETALSQETVDAMVGDLGRIGVVTAFVTFLLLAVFLRAVVAPLLLLAGSVLAFAGSFGLMALLHPLILGGSDVVYYVPLVAAVLLVGLGSDYNVFIAGRIREEAGRRRLREAIAVAAPSASRAITVAGITLASTFALLALIPLRPFRELALLMTLGVLVDALLVRPLLIPALIAIAGRAAWWPSNPRKPAPAGAFLQGVARRCGQGVADPRRITGATLETLAERIPARESQELAAHLPASMRGPLERASGASEAFSADEFVRRVAERADESPEAARSGAAAVFGTLAGLLPPTELDYVRAALSEDYRGLFGDAPESRGEGASSLRAG